jgi:hypothetical protein
MEDAMETDDWRAEREDDEAELAAREAAAVGGTAGDEELDPAERPLAEAGEGVAEGFELAEEELIDHATHADSGGNPLADAFSVEAEKAPDGDVFGEADHEHSSENEQ